MIKQNIVDEPNIGMNNVMTPTFWRRKNVC